MAQLSLQKKQQNSNVDYLAFGSFFKSKLKPKAKKANFRILKQVKKGV